MNAETSKAPPQSPALDLAAAEIERLLSPYDARWISAQSDEWRGLVAQESRERRISYWYWRRRLLGWMRSRRRRNRFVEQTYNRIWSEPDLAMVNDPAAQRMAHQWRDRGFIANAAITQKLHLAMMIKAIRALRPKTVLEVGSGRGVNLLVLACHSAETAFRGLELTENGVATARAMAAAAQLPDALLRFMPEAPSDPTGYRRIQIDRGSAEHLPYPDASFDLVITRLALEQMEEIRPQALSEIARVARSHVLMIESFREMNDEGLRRQYAVGSHYFRGAIAELPRYGLQPILVFDDWPHKITLKPVLMLAKRTGKAA